MHNYNVHYSVVRKQLDSSRVLYLLSGSILMEGPKASKYVCFIAASAHGLLNILYYKYQQLR